RTAKALAEQFNIDQHQAERIKDTALRLFDQVTAWKNKRQIQELREILQWASLLHEVGISINHNGAHRHSAYIIANRDLPGFDSEQQTLLATLMRYHLKGFKRHDLKIASRFQHRDILTLLRIFRLAVLLNRSRQATNIPMELNLSIQNSSWHLS
ncbi:exopolyphosphatase, partial [Glaesserella parasuis]